MKHSWNCNSVLFHFSFILALNSIYSWQWLLTSDPPALYIPSGDDRHTAVYIVLKIEPMLGKHSTHIVLCDFSWGDVNKYLFIPDIALMVDQRNDPTQKQVNEPVSLGGLLKSGWADSYRYMDNSPKVHSRQLTRAASLKLPCFYNLGGGLCESYKLFETSWDLWDVYFLSLVHHITSLLLKESPSRTECFSSEEML